MSERIPSKADLAIVINRQIRQKLRELFLLISGLETLLGDRLPPELLDQMPCELTECAAKQLSVIEHEGLRRAMVGVLACRAGSGLDVFSAEIQANDACIDELNSLGMRLSSITGAMRVEMELPREEL